MQYDNIVIALDGNGGDQVSSQLPQAIKFAIKKINAPVHFLIYGSKILEYELKNLGILKSYYTIIECNKNIPQDATIKEALNSYQNSSMYLCIQALKNKQCNAVLSSGGTGPLVAISRHILGCLYNQRPALCAIMPNSTQGFALMLDLGANASCKAQDLYSFALLGSCYYKALKPQVQRPSIALLNVGTENKKGNNVIKEAKNLIINDSNLNYQGFVEANKMLTSCFNVIVSDGFSGNIALKSAEGVVGFLKNQNKLKRFFLYLAKPSWLDAGQYNGSVLLGVDGVVVKSHASSQSKAIASAIVNTYRLCKNEIYNNFKQELKLNI